MIALPIQRITDHGIADRNFALVKPSWFLVCRQQRSPTDCPFSYHFRGTEPSVAAPEGEILPRKKNRWVVAVETGQSYQREAPERYFTPTTHHSAFAPRPVIASRSLLHDIVYGVIVNMFPVYPGSFPAEGEPHIMALFFGKGCPSAGLYSPHIKSLSSFPAVHFFFLLHLLRGSTALQGSPLPSIVVES